MFPRFAALLFVILFAVGDVSSGEDGDDRAEPTGGTINDLFTYEETVYRSDEYSALKQKILSSIPDDVDVEDLFAKVEKRLRRQVEALAERGGGDAVPVVEFDKIRANGGRLPDGAAERVRRRGVVVVRNVVPADEVERMVADLLKYMYDNNAFPAGKNQSVYEVYWSKSQLAARQHPRMYAVQKALLGLWHARGEGVDADLNSPAMYVDRLRIRPPGDAAFTLPPHIDGGGVERWKDDDYRRVYRHILSGNVDEYDPFEIDDRVLANMNDFGYENGCTFFRAFQGWLSLGNTGPGRGTLRVFPLLRESTAYWYLRPFLRDVDADVFPGCFPGKTFHVSNKYHPAIHDHLVSVPNMGPGDAVFWHADLVHSVESEHRGREHSSVFYIPAGPDCALNRRYLRRMRHAFAAGRSPPDFPRNDYEVEYRGRATPADLTEMGRAAMGWTEDEDSDLGKKSGEETCQGKGKF